MKIRLLEVEGIEDIWLGNRAGTELDLRPEIAHVLVDRGIAEFLEEEKEEKPKRGRPKLLKMVDHPSMNKQITEPEVEK
jgi:hypothetical protein